VNVITKFQIQLRDKYLNDVKSCPFDIESEYKGSLYGSDNADVKFECVSGVMVGSYVVKVAGPYQLMVRFKNNVLPSFPTGVTAS